MGCFPPLFSSNHWNENWGLLLIIIVSYCFLTFEFPVCGQMGSSRPVMALGLGRVQAYSVADTLL